MDTIDFYIINDLDKFENLIIMSRDNYNNIIDYINFNYLFILFTIGCFSSILCCNKNNNTNKYVIVPSNIEPINNNIEPIKGKVIEP